MAKSLVDQTDLHLFWSAYDPLDLASDSIDPLGFMAGYVALADRILPGFTTLTTVPRYAGMLCSALKWATEEVGGEVNLSIRRREVMERLKLFERAWALACGLAEQDEGEKAISGVRGVRGVRRWLTSQGTRERMSLNYTLLSNQVRYGGIGAYSTFLESLHLADMTSLRLRPLGEDLASAFPSITVFGIPRLTDGGLLPMENLRAWGREAHAGILSTAEAQLLRRALRGDEEAEVDDHTRWTMLRLLRRQEADTPLPESTMLNGCLSLLRNGELTRLDALPHVDERLQRALQVIEPYERMYQCAAFLFDCARSAAAGNGRALLSQVGREEGTREATREVRLAAGRFLQELETARGDDLGPARPALQKLGIVDLAGLLSQVRTPVELCQMALQRHARVQEGKLDGGLPKGPWIRLEDDQEVRLTAQRFALDPSQAIASWNEVVRHPYRTYGARQFIRLCRITE